MGDPHQDKTHRLTGDQMAIPLNMGGSCSVCVPLYITKRSEAVLQWGKRKNIKKECIENRNYGGIIEKRTQHLVI